MKKNIVCVAKFYGMNVEVFEDLLADVWEILHGTRKFNLVELTYFPSYEEMKGLVRIMRTMLLANGQGFAVAEKHNSEEAVKRFFVTITEVLGTGSESYISDSYHAFPGPINILQDTHLLQMMKEEIQKATIMGKNVFFYLPCGNEHEDYGEGYELRCAQDEFINSTRNAMNELFGRTARLSVINISCRLSQDEKKKLALEHLLRCEAELENARTAYTEAKVAALSRYKNAKTAVAAAQAELARLG